MATSEPIHPTWRRSRPVWFSVLCNALAAHDFALAQEAKDNLRRLGVTVEFRGMKAIVRVSPPYSAGEGGL